MLLVMTVMKTTIYTHWTTSESILDIKTYSWFHESVCTEQEVTTLEYVDSLLIYIIITRYSKCRGRVLLHATADTEIDQRPVSSTGPKSAEK